MTPMGSPLCDLLRAHGVVVDPMLRVPSRRTLTKTRVIADSHLLVRFDDGTEAPLAAEDEQRLIGRLIDLFAEHDAVIVSDYGYGLWTPPIIQALRDLQARSQRIVVADSRHQLGRFRDVALTAIKPNYREAVELLGTVDGDGAARAERLLASGPRLFELTGAQIAAVTLDQEGAIVFERERPPYRTYAASSRSIHATGAGDTFVSAFALALAVGAHTPAAAELASAAAALVVAKDGTAVCTADEVRDSLAPDGKIIDLARLVGRVESYRRQGRRLVFTNGCYDLLHRGHITCLNHAKGLGDVLIVGVNSDRSVQRLKGPTRPITPLEDRLHILAALSCIDHLVAFDDDSPLELLHAIRPDVYVKGGDYRRETLPEVPVVEALGGRIHLLPYVEDQSTTGIIERIQTAWRRKVGVKGRSKKGEVLVGPSSLPQ